MENYYLVEIATGDPKIAGKAVYSYNNRNDAIANFHSKMGAAMKSELYTTELLVVLDKNGMAVEREIFERVIIDNVEE